MLIALKELNEYVNRMITNVQISEKGLENGLEMDVINGFNLRFDQCVESLVTLQALTKGESAKHVTSSFRLLGSTKQQILQLLRQSLSTNKELIPIIKKIKAIIEKKKKTIKSAKHNLNLAKEVLVAYEQINPKSSPVLAKVTTILGTNYLENKEDLHVFNLDLQEVLNELNALQIKNRHVTELIEKAGKELKEYIALLMDNLELRIPTQQGLSQDVIDFISKKLHLKRDATAFQPNMEEGHTLVSFKNQKQGNYDLFTYGTDFSEKLCRKASENGVDYVAKKGIYKISHHTFDLVLNLLNTFTFHDELTNMLEKSQFEFIFERSIPKNNAYIIFNIPSFKLPVFQKRIQNHLTIEGMYRVDDDMKNILFISRYKQSNRNDLLLFKKAMLDYKSLPHYTEMNDIVIDQGECEQPKTFRANFIDDEDIFQAFKDETSSLDIVEELYRPKEKVIELSRPLQEYKEGHLAAVAAIEVVNGIYDIEDIDFPVIYSSKIVQKEAEDEKEVMHKGELVTEISTKKTNAIVTKALLPDGKIIHLLDTSTNNSEDDEED